MSEEVTETKPGSCPYCGGLIVARKGENPGSWVFACNDCPTKTEVHLYHYEDAVEAFNRRGHAIPKTQRDEWVEYLGQHSRFTSRQLGKITMGKIITYLENVPVKEGE